MRSAPAFRAMRRKIQLSHNRTLWACYSRVKPRTGNWIVFVPESGAEYMNGSRAELARFLGASLARQFNYLAVNKPGVGPFTTDKDMFERSFRRELRMRDTLAAMKAVIPKGDRIFLVGYSEGAYLAPQIAVHDRRVKSVVMIGGGTRGWLKEEISNALPRERAIIRQQIERILRKPAAEEKWNGFSYATWHSYREDHTLKALGKLNRPTLALLGARDRTIDFKTALEDLQRLSKKKPVAVEVLPRCGHSFTSHWPDVGRAVREFLDAHK